MNTEQMRQLLGAGKLDIGLSACQRAVESGSAKTVFVASNAPAIEAGKLSERAKLSGVSVESLDATNSEIGTMCRKPFPISFLSVKS